MIGGGLNLCGNCAGALYPASIANALWRATVSDWRGLWRFWTRESDAGGMADGMSGQSFQGTSHPVTVPTIPGGTARNEAGAIPYIPRLREAGFLETSQPGRGVALSVSLR